MAVACLQYTGLKKNSQILLQKQLMKNIIVPVWALVSLIVFVSDFFAFLQKILKVSTELIHMSWPPIIPTKLPFDLESRIFLYALNNCITKIMWPFSLIHFHPVKPNTNFTKVSCSYDITVLSSVYFRLYTTFCLAYIDWEFYANSIPWNFPWNTVSAIKC